MGQYEMRARLEELIGAERGRVLPGWLHSYGVRLLAEHLLAAGVLVPPVKEGQTVYAAIRMADPDDGDDGIDEWQVHGVMYKEGKWYAIDRNGDESVVGAWDCLLTREEAQKFLDEEEKKNDKDTEKAG